MGSCTPTRSTSCIARPASNGACRDDLDLEAVVDQWAALPLLFQPGTEWNYSVGLDVLGRVLEVITGQRLDELMRTRLLEPLGMDETTWFVDEAHAPRLAALYGARPADPQGRAHGRHGPRHAARTEGPRRRRRAGQHRRTTTTGSRRCCSAAASSTAYGSSRPAR